jgi:hypothetical protein
MRGWKSLDWRASGYTMSCETTKDYAKHITELLIEHDITMMIISNSEDSCAFIQNRKIHCSEITSDITYCIALHEIGHIVGNRRGRSALYAELGAWEWAIETAIEWTYYMNLVMRICLWSHVDGVRATVNLKTNPIMPHTGHKFWKLAEREPLPEYMEDYLFSFRPRYHTWV